MIINRELSERPDDLAFLLFRLPYTLSYVLTYVLITNATSMRLVRFCPCSDATGFLSCNSLHSYGYKTASGNLGVNFFFFFQFKKKKLIYHWSSFFPLNISLKSTNADEVIPKHDEGLHIELTWGRHATELIHGKFWFIQFVGSFEHIPRQVVRSRWGGEYRYWTRMNRLRSRISQRARTHYCRCYQFWVKNGLIIQTSGFIFEIRSDFVPTKHSQHAKSEESVANPGRSIIIPLLTEICRSKSLIPPLRPSD